MKAHLLALSALALAAPAAAAESNIWSTSFDVAFFEAIGPFSLSSASVIPAGGDFDSAGTTPGGGTQVLRNSTTNASIFGAIGIAPNAGLKVSFDLIFVDSWDSIDGFSGVSPDILYLTVGGTEYELTAANASGSIDNFGPGTLQSRGAYLGSTGTYMDNDALVSYSFMLPAASSFTMSIRAGGAGWQGSSDESWAIDNFSLKAITRNGPVVPEPATWAMMIAGFGVVGAAARRRRAASATA